MLPTMRTRVPPAVGPTSGHTLTTLGAAMCVAVVDLMPLTCPRIVTTQNRLPPVAGTVRHWI